MRKKQRFLVCALLAIMISLLCQTTFAYFTVTMTADNLIATGGIDVVLHQKNADGKPVADVGGVMPGSTVSRVVTVENKQDDAFVRVKLDLTVCDRKGKKLEMTDAELAKLFVIDYNTRNWTEKDGVWYYNTALTEGAVTEPLFTEVFFDIDAMTNVHQSISISMSLQAQATQVANNGTDPLTAAGWPEF